jgi:hypothetical protein
MKRSSQPDSPEEDHVKDEESSPPALSTAVKRSKSSNENDDGDTCLYLDISKMTAQEFFDRVISKRRPAVLQNCALDILTPLWQKPLQEEEDHFCSRRNLERYAGQTIVDIDVKTEKLGFGYGNLQKMTFADFCKQTTNCSDHYLTTQPIAVDEEDRPYIMSQPLLDYYRTTKIPFPKHIPFMPVDMQLMNINLWIGRTSTPTSSRFHHDFHDNVYFLLKGSKKFRLASFQYAKKLPTNGTLAKIYPNGRIVYKEQEPVREDGAPMVASELLRLSIQLEQVQAQMDACTDKNQQEKLENELENILQQQLDLEVDDEEGRNGDDSSQEDKDEEFQGLNFGIDQGDTEPSTPAESKGASHQISKQSPPSVKKEQILNFCQFDSYEAEKKGIPILEVQLKAGDVFYLPAGWYHEVLSSGAKSDDSTLNSATNKNDWHPDVHMAMNYWYFPPNTDSSLDKPYHDDFWKHNGQQE